MDIVPKNTGDSLTAAEFNQIVDELENTSNQKVDLLVRDSNAENKIKNKKEKRLRGPA